MKGSLRLTLKRSTTVIRQFITFLFLNIFPGTSVTTRSFRVTRILNTGEVILSQRRAAGGASPVVRYQFVNAVNGLPVTNSVTLTGTRIVVLPFTLPAGTFRLKVTNVGTSGARVEGGILVF